MKLSKTLVLIVGLLVMAITAISFSANQQVEQGVQFVVPKGWPKPVYDIAKHPLTQEGFKLGRRLFFDPVLSADSSISCSSCHTQFSAFTHVDHPLSHGINGLKGTRNSLALYNLAWAPNFMWDGRVSKLEDQPLNPITNPVEMDNTIDNIVLKLNESTSYKRAFKKAFGDSTITGNNVLKALCQFLISLQSYNSKYDKVIVQRDRDIHFTEEEKKGLMIFRDHCAQCHKEPLFTDYSFKNIGLSIIPQLNDYGRFAITKDKRDSLLFRVPSLRNVMVTYPYMHDGRFNTIEQVIDHYINGVIPSATLAPQLRQPIYIDKEQKNDLIAFLKTLTDESFLYDMRFRDWRDN